MVHSNFRGFMFTELLVENKAKVNKNMMETPLFLTSFDVKQHQSNAILYYSPSARPKKDSIT